MTSRIVITEIVREQRVRLSWFFLKTFTIQRSMITNYTQSDPIPIHMLLNMVFPFSSCDLLMEVL